MQQQMFRDALWAVVEASDRGDSHVEESAFNELASMHPGITKSRYDEMIDLLVRTDHLRRWGGPTDAAGNPVGPGTLMPTAKARLQFAVVVD